MLRKLYATGIVIAIVVLVVEAMNDPVAVSVWNYLRASNHAPIEYLIIITFGLVLLDRVDKMLAAWGTEKDQEATSLGGAVYTIGRTVDRIEDALRHNNDAVTDALKRRP